MAFQGICKTCGKLFTSRGSRRKKYCTMTCYQKDPETAKNRSKWAIERAKKAGTRIELSCDWCGATVTRKKSDKKTRTVFCNKDHRRRFYDSRFDRWIASPQALALPQNYDEYLTLDELPCLVVGCDWKGQNLSMHVNHTHGIHAEEFKKLAGFNLTSGLVTPELWDKYRENALARDIGIKDLSSYKRGKSGEYQSLEGKEHAVKGHAMSKAVRYSAPTHYAHEGICRQCSLRFTYLSFQRTFYCTHECRQEYYNAQNMEKKYNIACSQCGESFLGNKYQYMRTQKCLPVACSMDCKQSMNGSRPNRTEGARV